MSDRRERTSTDNGDAFLVRTEVPRRVHCCEPSVYGTRIGQMERERKRERERETLLSLSVFVHMLIHALPSRERTHGGKEKEKEEKESVGGSVANHFLPGRVRSSNNRILVRAASEKGCTPLYVRSERTATKKIKERRGEKKEGKEGEGEKKRSKVLLE